MKLNIARNLLTVMLLLLAAAPAAAQVQFDLKSLYGKWNGTMDGAGTDITFKKDGTCEFLSNTVIPGDMGNIIMKTAGKWSAESNVITLDFDFEKIDLKFDIADDDMRQMMEQQIEAGRAEILKRVSKIKTQFIDVVLTGDTLSFTQVLKIEDDSIEIPRIKYTLMRVK